MDQIDKLRNNLGNQFCRNLLLLKITHDVSRYICIYVIMSIWGPQNLTAAARNLPAAARNLPAEAVSSTAARAPFHAHWGPG